MSRLIEHRTCVLPAGVSKRLVLPILVLLLLSTSVRAQHWNIVGTFPAPIGCGFFFDENTGFVGAGIRLLTYQQVAIYKTTDGGQTWTPTQTPLGLFGAVTDIFMQTKTIGYATIFTKLSGQTLLQTTDGGNSWNNISPTRSGEGSCVYATSAAIVLTEWAVNGGFSTDGGAIFSQDFNGAYGESNGIDFTDSLHGVATMGPLLVLNAPVSYYTTDGGLSWRLSYEVGESWGVYGVKGTMQFFSAGEGYAPDRDDSVFTSLDGGATWKGIYSFHSRITLTGGIGGSGHSLYFQTDSLTSANGLGGLYRSDDLGLSWKNVGGPATSRDTRFVVTGCSGQVVYAFDLFGNVWKTIDGGDGTLANGNPNDAAVALDRDTLLIATGNCQTSRNFALMPLKCPSVYFDSAVVDSSPDVAINPNSFGAALAQGDTAHVTATFSPLDTGTKYENVRVYSHAGSRVLIDTLVLKLISSVSEQVLLSRDTIRLAGNGCPISSDSLTISIIGCYGLVIDSAEIVGKSFALLSSLPDSVGPDGVFNLPVMYSSQTNGTDSAAVHVFGHSGLHQFDTTIMMIGATTLPQPAIALSADSIKFATRYCVPTASQVFFSNPLCTSITIDSVVASVPYSLVSNLSGLVLDGGASDTLNVLFSPLDSGTAAGTITIYAHSGGGRLVKQIQLSGFNQRGAVAFQLSKDTLSLVTANCGNATDSIKLWNQGCQSITLDSVVSFTSEVSCAIGKKQLSVGGDSTGIAFHYVPDSGCTKLGALHFFYHIGAVGYDTVLNCSVANILPPSLFSVSPDTANLVTYFCQPVTLPVAFSNSNCLAMTLDSLRLTNDSLSEFSIDTTGLNPIGSLSSSRMKLMFSPNEPGKRPAQVELFLHSGSHAFDTLLTLSGDNITAPAPYLLPLTPSKAGDTVSFTVMIEPTTDTFQMQHLQFHLGFNTDLITPVNYTTSGTLSSGATNIAMTNEPGSGVSFSEDFPKPVTQKNNLTLPLITLHAKVFLTKELASPVTMDSFGTLPAKLEPLCTVPSLMFTSLTACGDTTIRAAMLGNPIGFDSVVVYPDPVTVGGQVRVDYSVSQAGDAGELDIYDAAGRLAEKVPNCSCSAGHHTVNLQLTTPSGEYVLVLRSSNSEISRKFVIER